MPLEICRVKNLSHPFMNSGGSGGGHESMDTRVSYDEQNKSISTANATRKSLNTEERTQSKLVEVRDKFNWIAELWDTESRLLQIGCQ